MSILSFYKIHCLSILLMCTVYGVTPGTVRSHTTLHSISLEIPVSNDANHNAACTVRYRVQGNMAWHNALPLLRIDFNGANTLAGSIFFLTPDTTYDIELNITDPDGGNARISHSCTTRKVPEYPVHGNEYHVVPGTGGGTGSVSDPFQGIAAAQSIAQPGDIFLLHPGNYGGRIYFTVSGTNNAHIVWKNAERDKPIIEGVRIEAHYIWLEGVQIEQSADNNNALLTSPIAPENVVVTRNFITNCHYGVRLNDGGSDWYITDNVIVGDTDPASGSFSGEGIELEHTSGHVVAYNDISFVADGVSYPHYDCDIYNNEIHHVSDDGIEADYGYSNIRIWCNRITYAGNNGISFQPMNGAPWYVIRNQVAAPNENALKLRTPVDRALIAQNTFVCWSGVQSVDTQLLLNFMSRNNLWISINDRYVWENGNGGNATWKTDLDYDGFDWNDNYYAFKWGSDGRYTNITEFTAATGLETHGIHVQKDHIFDSFNVPDMTNIPVQYMTLKTGCNAIDAGVVLSNINENFTGAAPDLGAYENGMPLPHYGPRDIVPEPHFISVLMVLWLLSIRRKFFS